MTNIWTWSTTAATNSNADSGINWAEGQLPPTVNDSARMMMKRLAELLKDMGGVNVTTGSANAQLLAPTGTWNSNADGRRAGFTAGFTNTGAMTLNISSVGAAAVLLNNAALTGGEVVAGGHYEVVYHTASGSRLVGFHLVAGKQAVLAGTAASTVVVTDNVNAALRVTQLGTGNTVLFEDSANPDASPWLINGDGVQVKGHTAALATFLDWAGTQRTAGVQNHSLTYADSMHAIGIWPGAVAGGPTFVLGKTRGASPGTYTIVASSDNLGTINFEGSDGTDFAVAAQIMAEVDGTPGSDDMPGRLVFKVTPDGSQTPATAFTIKATGQNLFTAGTTARAPINIPAGVAPTSPADGDHWTVTDGIYWRINGTTRAFNNNLWTISGLTLAQGDLLYATGAGAVTQLAKGTADQVLTMNSGATAPEWANVADVLIADQTPTNGSNVTDITVDWTLYTKVEMEWDTVGCDAAVTAMLAVVINGSGAIVSASLTAATMLSVAAAAADRYTGLAIMRGSDTTGASSHYHYTVSASGTGQDASGVTVYGFDSASDGDGSATRATGVRLQITGGGNFNGNGRVRVYGRRRLF